jgi:hypothetical protein
MNQVGGKVRFSGSGVDDLPLSGNEKQVVIAATVKVVVEEGGVVVLCLAIFW